MIPSAIDLAARNAPAKALPLPSDALEDDHDYLQITDGHDLAVARMYRQEGW